LVDRDPDASILDRAKLIDDLEDILGRRVEVVVEAALHWFAKPQILHEAVPV
jgi:predicted nucleotidyltransferase